MRDLFKQVENMVKDELAQACQAQGIDKSEVGYCIGGMGVISPQVMRNPETGESGIVGFAPTWQITVSIRHKLLGHEPVAGSRPVYDVMPTREDIKQTVYRLVNEVYQMREAQFTGSAS